MRYLSVCSGIEAATVAWHHMGWEPLAFSEIERFPRSVLAHHYPDVPCHGDFTLLRDQEWIADADLLVGGTPCQAFSVAGKRQSLADDRGNLTLEYVRLADAIDNLRLHRGAKPSIVVWENVPGVLSVRDNAFGCFLGALAGSDEPLLPPGGKWTRAGLVVGPQRRAAWRVLDAQYFGVAQRRRRLFIVASARDDIHPAEVLFEREGLRRNTPPRRKAGQGVAGTLEASLGRSRGAGTSTSALSHWDGEAHPHPTLNQSHNNSGGVGQSNQEIFSQRGAYLAPSQPFCLANTLTARAHKGMNSDCNEGQTPIVTHTLRGDGFDASEDGTGRGTPLVPVAFHPTQDPISSTDGSTHALGCGSKQGQASVAVAVRAISQTLTSNYGKQPDNSDTALGPNVVFPNMAVRRLTPRECERLQGFPDDYTLISDKTADGPRYKALGNSMAVPVMRWIGERIQKEAMQ